MRVAREALNALFAPEAVAVVGASPDAGKPGGRCLAFLRRFGYQGRIYPVNPRYAEIGGLTVYPDLESLPEAPDLMVLLVPATSAAQYLRRGAAAGARAAVVCSSGFAEAGPEGAALQAELAAVAVETGLAVLGPNSLGLINMATGLTATFTTGLLSEGTPNPGPVAFISQSGALGAAMFALSRAEGIGFGKFLSTGNEASLDFADLLDYLADDPGTSVILGYIEGIRDGRKFVAAARRARAAGKAVAVLKVGNSDAGSRAARSHTGALAGSAQAYQAAFRRTGVLEVGDVRALLDLAAGLPGLPPVRGPRVGIISMSGGAGVMMADRCSAGGLVVPALADSTREQLRKVLPGFAGMGNPVDYGPVYGDPSAIESCVDLVASDPNVDLALVFLGLSPGMSGVVEERIAAAQKRSGKPVVVAWLGGPRTAIQTLRSLGVAACDDPTRAADLAIHTWRASAPLPGDAGADPEGSGQLRHTTQDCLRSYIAVGRTILTEREVKLLLTPYGIPVVPEALATSAEEAVRAAERLGGPVAVKAEAEDLVHKSDIGAVRLHVTPAEAGEAFRAVVGAARGAGTAVRGAVVQPMAPPGLEVLAGLRFDPQFGPTLTVGLGGVISEVLGDVTTELAPVTPEIALTMIGRLRSAPLFGSFRGASPRDTEALARLLADLSRFAADAGSLLAELDLNPVIVLPSGQGCLVVDGAAILSSKY